ncbi:ABC transporter ATP-binding protein [Paenibacillus sp. TRM 82003]|nr:ABC transporter ATP-binding protein [Paenibacillus sp. TRM 82003]
MKQPIIEFEGFGFQYRAQAEPTLQDIDLTIYAGEKVLIAGPSGSGKSTLAHCLNGLVPFFHRGTMTGSLRIRGKEQQELSIYKLAETVGTVLQDPDGQFVGLTVGEDIAFKLENDNVDQAEMIGKVRSAAKTVGIEGRLDASPHALSGGQKQKVTLAGAMVDDVEILLFDEPLASLDPRTGQEAVELIDRLHRETGKTVVIVEHRIEEVLHCPVDRIILIVEGRVAADAAPEVLLRSGKLRDVGLREPLHATALAYAGVQPRPELRLSSLDDCALEPDDVAKLRTWHERHAPAAPAAPGETLLELDRVSFGYDGGPPVVKDVSLRIRRGEMVCLVGRNGAGKSTISKLVCGFYRPTGGRIRFKEEDLRSLSIQEIGRRIGFIMQNPNQMISKPGIFDEVALGLRLRGTDEEQVQAKVAEALRICGLSDYRSWPISALSYGQKKRVTIASILTLDPELLILDEPTAGQDFKHYNEIMTFLSTLNQRGVTIVMITHDMHLMLEYADRALVMADGRLIADRHPSEALGDPDIAAAANLKETSVHRLAAKAGIEHPEAFVRRFIAHDKEARGR